jgi:hypothetical protein
MDDSCSIFLLVPCSALAHRLGAANGGCRVGAKLGIFEGDGSGTEVSRGDADDTQQIAR